MSRRPRRQRPNAIGCLFLLILVVCGGGALLSQRAPAPSVPAVPVQQGQTLAVIVSPTLIPQAPVNDAGAVATAAQISVYTTATVKAAATAAREANGQVAALATVNAENATRAIAATAIAAGQVADVEVPVTPSATPKPRPAATKAPARAPPTPRPATAVPVQAADVALRAWISDAAPHRNERVTVSGQIKIHGQPRAGVKMHAVWSYRTTTSTCDGVTDATGTANCTRDISAATPGFTVWVSLAFQVSGSNGFVTTTSFTPIGTVAAPTTPPAPSGGRTGATCRDGSHSNATGSGACSHHGGVDHWLYGP